MKDKKKRLNNYVKIENGHLFMKGPVSTGCTEAEWLLTLLIWASACFMLLGSKETRVCQSIPKQNAILFSPL